MFLFYTCGTRHIICKSVAVGGGKAKKKKKGQKKESATPYLLILFVINCVVEHIVTLSYNITYRHIV